MKVRQQPFSKKDLEFLRLALQLAKRGSGMTSPNPMVGAVLVKRGKIIGRGWHRRAGMPHAEIEALNDAKKRGHPARAATLYVTLEPCSTRGRTPPCTEAIVAAGIRRVVAGTTDPNPKHAGTGFKILTHEGVEIVRWNERPREPVRAPAGRSARQKLADDCTRLNEAFNHWIVQRTPFVTVKAAMTLDGKIATASGESKWITGEKARAYGMKLRRGVDAILVGVNTILADDPALTFRRQKTEGRRQRQGTGSRKQGKELRRIVLDSMARTPLDAKIITDGSGARTTIVVGRNAPRKRVKALAKRVTVLTAPLAESALRPPHSAIDLRWLLKKLGAENVTSLLVEGGGEVNASFLLGGLTQRVVFIYAQKILGGRDARKAVAGEGIRSLSDAIQLTGVEWKKIRGDLMMTGRVIGR
jgi:diaminohydroxyphosphoribosylaminopyrimidine deaminase/5-amino-6-(5-phosphoribosylamino)uracil reductase